MASTSVYRSSNPALSEEGFAKEVKKHTSGLSADNIMTVKGTVQKSLILLFLVVLPASYTWSLYGTGAMAPYMWGGAIGGLIMALVTIFKKEWAPYTAPIYALLQGLFLGGISAFFEAQFSGIVFQAVALTFGTMFTLLMAYQSGIIQVTEKFRTGVFAATGAIALVYLVSFVMNMFGGQMPYIHGNGLIGIGFSVVVVIVAALNLVLDFDFIDRASQQGAPRYMEWFAAFGLMVTLIWLYLEILRLLSKIRGD